MSDSYAPPVFTPKYDRSKRLVNGLRDSEKPTECRVFQVNLDGSIGKLLRIEEPVKRILVGNNGGKKN